MKVVNKPQMYRMLAAGAFGNTVEQWFSLEEWEGRTVQSPLWGLRNASSAGGDRRTALDVPTVEVAPLYKKWYGIEGGQISPMVDHMLTARFQLCEVAPVGLSLWVVVGLGNVKWREAFREHSANLTGLSAWNLLKKFLNSNSLDDLRDLLDAFPGHAIEMTTLDRCFGTMPRRNAVVWEVRAY